MEIQTNKLTKERLIQRMMESQWPLNSFQLELEYSYIIEEVDVNWNDIKLAIDNGFLEKQAAIMHAQKKLREDEIASDTVFDLALSTPCSMQFVDDVYESIVELASEVSETKKEISKEKLLFLVLKWVYLHREDFFDPLWVVASVLEDFNYSSEMIGFSYYVRREDLITTTIETHIKQSYDKWEDFLGKEAVKWGKQNSKADN